VERPSSSPSRGSRGPLALVGGEEFLPGNEPHDELLVRAAQALSADRPAFVIATAGARQEPERAVATACAWFSGLGLEVEELPLRTKGQARSEGIARQAERGRFFYLCGGDPGLVVTTLRGTEAWDAMLEAWGRGAPLAGSSAGAMALGEWTLIRARVRGDARRQPRDALRVVPGVAVVPHFADFGHRWVASAREALAGRGPVLLGIDVRTAAVLVGDEWRVLGAGAVTVVSGDDERRFAAGEVIDGLPGPTDATER
jgi:cyanophycinase